MNDLEKLGCRIFQRGMRAALPLLPYRKPRLLHHTIEVAETLQELGCGHVLLITDGGVRALGLTKHLEEVLAREGIRYTIYETIANPTTDVVERAVDLYRERGCSALIGFGGGSSMDTAKAVGARIATGKTYAQMGGILKVLRPIPPLFAFPTTAGTGSETTLAAVVIDSQTRHKYAIEDFPLIPSYAVLDPEATRTLPPHITAMTGLDALCHAVEAYIGNSTTAETRREAENAVRLVFMYLEDAYRDGGDTLARKQMLLASYLAGDAFSKSYVGYVHAVAHAIGGKYDVPHGLAIAVVMPHVLKAYGSAIDAKLHGLAVAARVARPEDDDHAAARRFLDALDDLERRLQVPATLPEVREQDIPEMARQAAEEANPLYPVPVIWDAPELERFFEAVMDGGTGSEATAAGTETAGPAGTAQGGAAATVGTAAQAPVKHGDGAAAQAEGEEVTR